MCIARRKLYPPFCLGAESNRRLRLTPDSERINYRNACVAARPTGHGWFLHHTNTRNCVSSGKASLKQWLRPRASAVTMRSQTERLNLSSFPACHRYLIAIVFVLCFPVAIPLVGWIVYSRGVETRCHGSVLFPRNELFEYTRFMIIIATQS